MTAVPEGDAPGAARVITQQLGWRWRHGVASEVVFQGKERIKAERLRQITEGHVLGEDRGIGMPLLG